MEHVRLAILVQAPALLALALGGQAVRSVPVRAFLETPYGVTKNPAAPLVRQFSAPLLADPGPDQEGLVPSPPSSQPDLAAADRDYPKRPPLALLPEPATAAFLTMCSGVLALGMWRRRVRTRRTS